VRLLKLVRIVRTLRIIKAVSVFRQLRVLVATCLASIGALKPGQVMFDAIFIGGFSKEFSTKNRNLSQ
jgi:hypothetical protein